MPNDNPGLSMTPDGGRSESVQPSWHDAARRIDDGITQRQATRGTATATPLEWVRSGQCPHCGSAAVYRWGSSETGVARRRCRGCRRTYSSRTGTLTAGLRQPAKFVAVLDDMLNDVPASCRRLAGRLGVDKMTVWHWRHKVLHALLGPEPATWTCPIDALAEPVRESRKGSREWVDHGRDPARHPAPNRPRWVDVDRHALPLPLPLIAFQLRVLISNEADACQPLVVPCTCPSAARWLCDDPGGAGGRRHRAESSCSTAAKGALARSAGAPSEHMADPGSERSPPELPVPRVRCPARIRLAGAAQAQAQQRVHPCGIRSAAAGPPGAGAAEPVPRKLGVAGPACLNAAVASFLRPFAGPAAKYLEAYIAWFIARSVRRDGLRPVDNQGALAA